MGAVKAPAHSRTRWTEVKLGRAEVHVAGKSCAAHQYNPDADADASFRDTKVQWLENMSSRIQRAAFAAIDCPGRFQLGQIPLNRLSRCGF